MKYVMLLSFMFATSAFAAEPAKPVATETKPVEKLVPGCPDGMICVTPEQLELFVRQQIESAKLNELSNMPAIQGVAKQYQDILKKNTPTK